MRKKWSDAEKARIAIMELREEKRSARLLKESGAHPNMISKWKKELIENADSAFRNGKSEKELEVEKEELYSQLGKLHAANDFLKKTHSRQGLL